MFDKLIFVFTVVIVMFSSAYAKSALRVSCEEGSENASIYINGEYRGECPRDLFLEAGTVKLQAVLKVDSEHERIYSTNIQMFDGAVKRVEVSLSSPQLTAEAVQAQKIRKEQEERRQAESALIRAKQGDVKAMREISGYYAQGLGIKRDSTQASYWDNKATAAKEQSIAASTLRSAQSGNTDAMSKMADFYDRGQGVQRDSAKAQMWREKEAEVFLRQANAGDVSAMEKVAGFYRAGYGVEVNHAESQKWNEKLRKIRNDKVKKEKNDLVKGRLNRERYYDKTQSAFIEPFKRDPSIVSISVLPSIVWFSIVDTVSIPTVSTKRMQIESQLNARAAQWKNPDSMMAKAYRQKYETNELQETILVSAR